MADSYDFRAAAEAGAAACRAELARIRGGHDEKPQKAPVRVVKWSPPSGSTGTPKGAQKPAQAAPVAIPVPVAPGEDVPLGDPPPEDDWRHGES